MPPLARLRSILTRLARPRRSEGELDEELAAYLELTVSEKLRAGADPAAARREALLELGGAEQVKESVRDVRTGIFIETALRDFCYGLRSLARTPAFTAAAVLALALGIGATTAIFSVVDAVLLRPLPYADPSRLVVVLHDRTNPVAPANYLDWKRQSTSFASMGAADYWTPNLTGIDPPESVQALRVTSDVLPLLGVAPSLGRLFVPEEERSGHDHSVILSDSLWRNRFGADRGILGRSVLLNGESYLVVGVMPRGFEFPPFWARGVSLWAPLALGERASSRDGQSLRIFARLKAGVPLGSARGEIAAITARLEKEFPGSNRGVEVNTLEEIVVGNIRPALLVLLGAVAFVLLIACANVAHMVLARSTTRRKEVAVRTALGAGRARLVRQFLAESLALALTGGAGGLLLASSGIRLLRAFGPAGIPRLETVALDVRVLAFAAGVTILTGLLFGLAPAVQSSRRDPAEALREGERGSTGDAGRGRLRSLLVASECALALVLLVGAGLMIRSFAALRRIDPGFDPRNVLTMTVSVAGSGQAAPGRRAAFYEQAVERVRALPDIESASAVNHLPLGGDIWGWSFTIEGRLVPAPGENPEATYRVVMPGYFRTMGIPLLRGRDISAEDRLGAPGAVVVNEWLARRYFPSEDPVGKRITFDGSRKADANWLTIVGVAKDAVRGDWAEESRAETYLAYAQTRTYLERPSSVYTYLTLVARARSDAAGQAPAVRRAIRSLDANVTIADVQTMQQVVASATAGPRFYLFLLVAFASSALALAAVGIFGVMSYAVSRRTHEIGIRMALGAGRRDVLRLVVGQGMAVALSGGAAGLLGAFLLTRLMKSLLYGVGATDPTTFLLAAPLLTLVAFGASYLPARRATRIDPITALRND